MDEEEITEWCDENIPMEREREFDLRLNASTARALVQLLSDDLPYWVKGLDPDTTPLVWIAQQLALKGYTWVDEGEDIYWWSTQDTRGEQNTTNFYREDRYKEFVEDTISPIFTDEKDARAWANTLQPSKEAFLYAHWGRGVMGPGARWSPAENKVITIL